MINPEFKRNLWLQFSINRLVTMPLILGMVFTAVAIDDISVLPKYASYLFVAIVWLWGTRNASASITEELREKTWDQQRMSALSPWLMTWGKLFGATAFNWYGGVICLVAMFAGGLLNGHAHTASYSLGLILTGVLLHAAAIALSLHLNQAEMQGPRRGGLAWLVMGLGLIYYMVYFPWSLDADGGKPLLVNWWSATHSRIGFLLVATAMFTACAVFAAFRTMSNALQVRTTPWAWPAFAGWLTAYVAGFSETPARLYYAAWLGLVIAGAMTYAGLLTEANSRFVWQRVVLRTKKRQWRSLFELVPMWPTTLALCMAFTFMTFFTSVNSGEFLAPEYAPRFIPLVMALMVLRDAFVFLFFAFAPRARRVVMAMLLYMVVINVVLPFFLRQIGGGETLATLVMPLAANETGSSLSPGTAIGVAAVHAAIAVSLAIWRWRNSAPSNTP